MDVPAPPKQRPAQPGLQTAFWYWLKLGFISFGGPAGQIAIMHQELVEKRRWISERRFLHALNYCMLLPGPEAQQLAIYIGWLLHRTWGGILAGVLFVLPSLFILSALSFVYLTYGDAPLVQGVFAGIKPAIVAIIAFAAWRIGSRSLTNIVLKTIATCSFLAIFVFDMAFPYIVIAAALAGFVGGRIAPARFTLAGSHAITGSVHEPALIDDDTPPLPHTRFSWMHLFRLLAVVLLLGAAVWHGLSHPVLRDMGAFFTKAALVTFGGAYAVLPYVFQGAVEHHQWLTATQMIDGMALGETTPGPLIMVVSFVGFVGGWSKALFGPDALLLAGFAGASVAAFFTFLPSFLFILAGGPLVESTHGKLGFTAPLTAITAAVVGVILHLAVHFGWLVMFPLATDTAPFSGGIEWLSAAITVVAFVALWRFKQSIFRVMGVCAAIGVGHTLVLGAGMS